MWVSINNAVCAFLYLWNISWWHDNKPNVWLPSKQYKLWKWIDPGLWLGFPNDQPSTWMLHWLSLTLLPSSRKGDTLYGLPCRFLLKIKLDHVYKVLTWCPAHIKHFKALIIITLWNCLWDRIRKLTKREYDSQKFTFPPKELADWSRLWVAGQL